MPSVLITGASRGIGLEFARQYAADGWRVHAACRDPDGARETGPLCADHTLTWDKVRRVVPARFGVHLSPRHNTSRLLPDRGLFLRTAGNRAEVLDYVERMAP